MKPAVSGGEDGGPALTTCPACGQLLPAYARFCARCGTPQPAPWGEPPRLRGPQTWVVVAFWVGAVIALLLGLAMAAAAALPGPAGPDPAQVRATALVLLAWAGSLCALQVVAAIGLMRGRRWAMTPATLACVAWALSCIGLPVAALVLAGLWRSPARGDSATGR